MNQPSVGIVVLTANRPEFAQQAIARARKQTYARKCIIVLDTGKLNADSGDLINSTGDAVWVKVGAESRTVGELRNIACAFAGALGIDIIAHFDDDDWSHPHRIAEQVALLQSSGADCIGYNQMLFWDDRRLDWPDPAPTWLYTNRNPAYALGTSLCYWRRTWTAKPFEALNQGEDTRWIAGLRCVGVTSATAYPGASGLDGDCVAMRQPRMIARIHPGNTSNAYHPGVMRACERQGGEWRRVPEWDAHCKSTMEAK